MAGFTAIIIVFAMTKSASIALGVIGDIPQLVSFTPMSEQKRYFFCGIGGSGMLPLAMILKAQGHIVAGSDRSLDQGRTPAKFDDLRAQGIHLFPQDGSGIDSSDQILIASAAVEDTVPDVAAALHHGAKRLSRAEMLATLFNAAPLPIGVAGTSGKSTTTAMLAWIFHALGQAPTVMNGAVMKNFLPESGGLAESDAPATSTGALASALIDDGAPFISEIDESDGSIALFTPKIALVNNISLDHKSMDELRDLFGSFVAKSNAAILNLDNDETRGLAKSQNGNLETVTYSLNETSADFLALDITSHPDGVAFSLRAPGSNEMIPAKLKIPGRHNVSNALAAIAAAHHAGLSVDAIVDALSAFEGVKRRLEFVGEKNGIFVYDDFAHNPDKITASLSTLHEFTGRLLLLFQPHGFGPIRHMKEEFIDCFATHLDAEDILFMPEPLYFGGTTDKSVSSSDIVNGVARKGRTAVSCKTREAGGDELLKNARSGDRIVVMGARDDTLSIFAQYLLDRLP